MSTYDGRTAQQFQSTHPARGATAPASVIPCTNAISIHAPREGCDRVLFRICPIRLNFNPRTPRGVRPLFLLVLVRPVIFQSTHPARGATYVSLSNKSRKNISIHAPREGCDVKAGCGPSARRISIHAPREGCDGEGDFIACFHPLFQSTHPARGATLLRGFTKVLVCGNFNPRTPRGVRPRLRQYR